MTDIVHSPVPDAAEAASFDTCMCEDLPALRRLRRELGRAPAAQRPALEKRLSDRMARSLARAEARRAAVPPLPEPPDLPIAQKRDDIMAAIARHQVVIVCGETGSGKTTQLPQLCLALGRGVRGMIGHTQPRRIAARSVAERISAEMKATLGQTVGYQVRFTDRSSPDSLIKLMTDGILLAETQHDRLLNHYDTLIIDEAHERSLNIDFLLGYLKQLLPKRPDLKVIITSATIDADRFSRHFDGAPVIEVSGRTYPVDVVYRDPMRDEDDDTLADLSQCVIDAVDELIRARPHGDILVFLPGEREIRDCQDALRQHLPPATEILPLFARLTAAEQSRVFERHNHRRVILATNVAETSLTVPGVVGVVDSGLARVNRYSFRSKVERLQTEKISQAAARQRAGRCGRVSSGVCIRLYSEEDFAARPEYTDPEIRRSNLASVILRMHALRLGDIDAFPFLEAPDARMIADGVRELQELGALDEQRHLTPLGQQMSRLPVDPRIGRMLLAAKRENCLTEMLVIAAALCAQDPRERPLEQQEAADQAHKRHLVEHSDFMGYLKVWAFFQEAQQTQKSRRKLLQYCKKNFLSLTRLREWQDVHSQLAQLTEEMDLRPNEVPAGYAEIHRALLAGLLGNVGMKTENNDYLGARNLHFLIFPGSSLHRKGPQWLVAAEIVETSRVYARTVAKIEPEWIEQIAGPLLKRSYSDPHWEKKQAQVVAFERVTLFGLPVVARRRVAYGRIHPAEARELFIREALVQGEFLTRAPFFAHNRQLVEAIEELEHKSRNRGFLVDEEVIFQFYDALLPAHVVSGADFERWRREAEQQAPRCLYLTRELLLKADSAQVTEERFPAQLELGSGTYPLTYLFEPGHPLDGVTMTVPLPAMNQLETARAEWLVPGLLREKIEALIRGLPQSLRRQFVPVPEFAQEAFAALKAADEPLAEALAAHLLRRAGVEIPAGAWPKDNLPPHLRMNFRVVDLDGKTVAEGRDFEALRQELRHEAADSFATQRQNDWERDGLTRWDFGELPDTVEITRARTRYAGYPALVDQGGAVGLRLLDSPEAAAAAHRAGLRRLFMLHCVEQVKYLRKQAALPPALRLQYTAIGPADALPDEFMQAVFDRVMLEDGALPRDEGAFAQRLAAGKPRLAQAATELVALLQQIVGRQFEVREALKKQQNGSNQASVQDMQSQLERLLFPGFLLAVPAAQLRHYPRYLAALAARLQKMAGAPAREKQLLAEVSPVWQECLKREALLAERGLEDAALAQYRWMVEEFRVSLFAQELKTPYPVSLKRLEKAWQAVRKG